MHFRNNFYVKYINPDVENETNILINVTSIEVIISEHQFFPTIKAVGGGVTHICLVFLLHHAIFPF